MEQQQQAQVLSEALQKFQDGWLPEPLWEYKH
jgi:hypothetical protein